MRWYSTRESVRAGEPTVLAIVETLLAMTATVAIGVWTGSWWHLLIASLITPLMLLRTEGSTRLGWAMLLRSQRADLPLSSFPLVILDVATYRLFLGAILARLMGVVFFAMRHPVLSGHAIPGNWARLVVATDFARSPELIPRPDRSRAGATRLVPVGESYKYIRRSAQEWENSNRADKEVAFGDGPLRDQFTALSRIARRIPLEIRRSYSEMYLFVLPAFVFRFSIKSTSIVWLPILWAVRPKKPVNEPWTAHLRMFGRSDWTKAKAVLSVLTILAALAKYVLFAAEADVVAELATSASPTVRALAGLLDRFYRPNVIPIWQIVAVFNGVVFLAALFLARHWDLRNQSGLAIDERRINTLMECLIGVTRLLAPYIILCNLWAAWHLAKKLPMPPVGSQLFPWL